MESAQLEAVLSKCHFSTAPNVVPLEEKPSNCTVSSWVRPRRYWWISDICFQGPQAPFLFLGHYSLVLLFGPTRIYLAQLYFFFLILFFGTSVLLVLLPSIFISIFSASVHFNCCHVPCCSLPFCLGQIVRCALFLMFLLCNSSCLSCFFPCDSGSSY